MKVAISLRVGMERIGNSDRFIVQASRSGTVDENYEDTTTHGDIIHAPDADLPRLLGELILHHFASASSVKPNHLSARLEYSIEKPDKP